MGRTGTGKTTLMSLMTGLCRPGAGMVSLLGYDACLVDPPDSRKLIGVLPQGTDIFEGTMKENITLGDGRLSTTESPTSSVVSKHLFVTHQSVSS